MLGLREDSSGVADFGFEITKKVSTMGGFLLGLLFLVIIVLLFL